MKADVLTMLQLRDLMKVMLNRQQIPDILIIATR